MIMQSGQSDSHRSPSTRRIRSLGVADTGGNHRIQAELNRLEQEARFLEEELDQLEKMEKASAACKELLRNLESRPDPLLPVTRGPQNSSWDIWFEGAKDAQGCRCWIL